MATASDDRETIAVASVDEDERDAVNHVPKSHLVRIIRPRVEEMLELVRDRLKAAGFSAETGRRVVLTGGGGAADRAAGAGAHADLQAGPHRPSARRPGAAGSGKGPVLRGAGRPAGLSPGRRARTLRAAPVGAFLGTGTDGYLSRMGRWLKDSF